MAANFRQGRCVVTDSGQLSDGPDCLPERCRSWFPWRKVEEAERRKLRSHINVLRLRGRRLYGGKHENGETPARQLVDELLSKDVCYEDIESAHEHADHLEELLPLIADEAYLRAGLAHELAGGNPDEGIKLSAVVNDAALQRLRNIGDGTLPDQSGEVAQTLSLLHRFRAGQMRHDRLMAKIRRAYLPILAGLIVFLLVLLAWAILVGNPQDASLDSWAQLLAVAAAGALGSVLAAIIKLRDTVKLNPLRALGAIIIVQPLIGASFGLMSWLILTSGLVTIGAAANSQAWQTQVVIAFASGFSEPLSLNIIGRAIRIQGSTGPPR